jgi:hypothetical protein
MNAAGQRCQARGRYGGAQQPKILRSRYRQARGSGGQGRWPPGARENEALKATSALEAKLGMSASAPDVGGMKPGQVDAAPFSVIRAFDP